MNKLIIGILCIFLIVGVVCISGCTDAGTKEIDLGTIQLDDIGGTSISLPENTKSVIIISDNMDAQVATIAEERNPSVDMMMTVNNFIDYDNVNGKNVNVTLDATGANTLAFKTYGTGGSVHVIAIV